MKFKLQSRSVRIFIVATVFALFIRAFVVDSYRITSDSMLPNLVAGDLILGSKYDFSLRVPFTNFEVVRIRAPVAGELVLLGTPIEPTVTFAKRVVATEGQRVAIHSGHLFVDEKPVSYQFASLDQSDIFEKLPNGTAYRLVWDRAVATDYGPVDIPPGHLFVLGDNRNDSTDSRSWGPVPYSFIKGKVRWIWLSLSDAWHVRLDRIAVPVQS